MYYSQMVTFKCFLFEFLRENNKARKQRRLCQFYGFQSQQLCMIMYIMHIIYSGLGSTSMVKKLTLLLLLVSLVISFQIKKDSLVVNQQTEFEAIPWPFTLCGDAADWKIESVTLDQAPKRNTYNDIDVTGTVNKAISFKRTEILVKLNGVFLDKEVIDFNQSYEAGDTVEFAYKNFVPTIAPSGNYGLTFQFYDLSEKVNGCFQFTFKL